MSSMLEQLWPIFLEEVSEKLDTVESMIADSNDETANVDALFREFHTLKSSFSMVDFKAPMELAHACEDVLHGLRKSNNIPDRDIRKYLLESIDWIKQQLADASPGQYPQHANEALLAKLAPFRILEDESTGENLQDVPAEADEQEASATKNIIEEKEALVVDTLRINSDSLDNLVKNVSQLALKEDALSGTIHDEKINRILDKARRELQRLQLGEDVSSDTMDELLHIFSQYRQTLLQADTDIQAAITNIQQEVLDLRIIPLSTIFNRLPRIVRQKANASGKQVQLVIEGGEVSIDKGMIEIISEPLIHLLHNAVMHGMESTAERRSAGKSDTSQINILASEQSGLLRIEVTDDGRGIDYRTVREKAIRKGFAKESDEGKKPQHWLSFLFTHGLNSENSHRDTGLDIVRDQLSSIGGTIDVYSTLGAGTRFVMRMPVTVAIQSAIIVQATEQTFAIPTRHLVEIVELPRNSLQETRNQASIDLRGNILPVYSLDTLLELSNSPRENSQSTALMLLILQNESESIALAVDNVLGRQELFLRDIHPDLRKIPGISGVSLLGNGNAIIILDCENLFRLAERNPEKAESFLC
jgi:two-component system, chemotaxis family, sensor kinase CheA